MYLNDCLVYIRHVLEGLSLANQNNRKLGVFDQKLEGNHSIILLVSYSLGAKGLKWRFFDHESEQAEFGLKL